MAINYRTRFAYRIDMWDADGENIIEHLAGVEDLQFARRPTGQPASDGPGHLSLLAKACTSLKTIGGNALCKERSGDAGQNRIVHALERSVDEREDSDLR
jgi:hypothetical protein